jgi:hypothetical protein
MLQPSADLSSDICGFCGKEFRRSPRSDLSLSSPGSHTVTMQDWEERVAHLQNEHKCMGCNRAKKFFRIDHFRQHLKHSHAGTSGKLTNWLENACMTDVRLPQPIRRPHSSITEETRPQILSKGEQVTRSHEVYGGIVRTHETSASFETPVKSIEDSMSNKNSPTTYPFRPFSSRRSTPMDLNISGHAVGEIGFLPLDKGNVIPENPRKRKIDTFEDLANLHKRRRTPTAQDLEQERVEALRLLGSPDKECVKNSKTATSNQGSLLKASPVREDRQGSMPLSDTELPFRLKDDVGQSNPLHYTEVKGIQLENEHAAPFEDILMTSEIEDNAESAPPAAHLVHTADVPQPVVLDPKQWEGMDDESAARFRYFLCRESLKALVGKLENPPDEFTAYTLTLVQATTEMMESNLRIWKRVERHP